MVATAAARASGSLSTINACSLVQLIRLPSLPGRPYGYASDCWLLMPVRLLRDANSPQQGMPPPVLVVSLGVVGVVVEAAALAAEERRLDDQLADGDQIPQLQETF